MTQWSIIAEQLRAHVVHISTPTCTGTGFFLHRSPVGNIAIATAAHVIEFAHTWSQPITIFNPNNGQSFVLNAAERAITVDHKRDSAAIYLIDPGLGLPAEPLELGPVDRFVRVGNEVAWMGFPAVAPAQLCCFFTGKISAWLNGDDAYLIDGVAISGVSGGPVVYCNENGTRLIGLVSAYRPNNRAAGATLPGLSEVRDLTQLHEIVAIYRSFVEARANETPAAPEPAAATPAAQETPAAPQVNLEPPAAGAPPGEVV